MTTKREGANSVIDFHSHLVPSQIVDEAERYSASYGLRVERDTNGLPVFAFDAGVRARPLPERLTSATLRVQELDSDNVDIQVIATWMEIVGYWIEDKDQAVRWARLQNESLLEVFEEWPDRFRILGTLPLPDVEGSLLEIRRLADAGVRGVQMSGHLMEQELDASDLDPLWGELQDNGMVVWLHPHHSEPPARLGNYFLHNLIGNPLDTTIGMAKLIFGGVLDRFPRLRFALAHGGGYLPYQVFRLDRAAETRSECGQPKRRPSDYLDRMYFDSILFDPRTLRYLAELVGHERLLFGTDSPFLLGDPQSQARVVAAFEGKSGILRQVLGGNASALLGIDPQ